MRIGELRVPFTLQAQDSEANWNHVQSLWGTFEIVDDGDYSHLSIIRAHSANVIVGQRLAYDDRYFLIKKVEKYNEEDRWVRLLLFEMQFLN